jgi:hypothetical protein
METKTTHSKYATGIFLTKRKSKNGKDYLELSIKNEQGYDKYLCFESDKLDKFGNMMYSIMIKEDKPQNKASDLPF